jgi:amidohydrolase
MPSNPNGGQTDDTENDKDFSFSNRLVTLVQRAAESTHRAGGPEAAVIYEGTVPCFGEDFAYFQKRIPGALLFLGVSNPEKGTIGMPHAPFYQTDDTAIAVGARAMAHVLFDHLAQSRR